jgi:NAD(P)-dependent dehydrogenase (short-subunit alcohol dehydrogenase family)
MDIVVWLRSLGLGKYEAAFRENEITEKVLPNLMAEDLKELGVTALGHRRKLLNAIAALADLVVFNAGNNQRIDFRALTAEQFEDFWRVGCFGGFLVGHEAARSLAPLGRGTTSPAPRPVCSVSRALLSGRASCSTRMAISALLPRRHASCSASE